MEEGAASYVRSGPMDNDIIPIARVVHRGLARYVSSRPQSTVVHDSEGYVVFHPVYVRQR